MRRGPDFDELLGGEELAPAERERLLRVHELLLAAGPPPELAGELRLPPVDKDENVFPYFPRHRHAALVALAAALAIAAFGGGYLVGNKTTGMKTARVVQMFGTQSAPGARASIELFEADASGNWPMLVTIRGLPPRAGGRSYELWLTKNGRPDAFCGAFTVHSGATEVWLSVPWDLKEYDGWVIAPTRAAEPALTT